MDSILSWIVLIAAAVIFLGRYFIKDYASFRNDSSIEVPRYTSLDASFKAMDRGRYHK